MDIKIDLEKCTGCAECIEVCPFEALVLVDGKPQVNEACTICGACAEVCDVGAISLPEMPKIKVDKGKTKDVWVCAEQRDGQLAQVVYELLGEARKLADALQQKVIAVLLGYRITSLAQELVKYGADKVYIIDHPLLKDFNESIYSSTLISLIRKSQPEVLLAGATARGRSVMPQISAALETGLTADCTGLAIDEKTGLLLQTRPAFGGNIMATIACPEKRPQMATVRPNVLPKPLTNSGRQGEIVDVHFNEENTKSHVQVIKFIKEIEDSIDLAEADVIVAGGRGLKEAKNFKLIKELAKLLGGAVGATRAVVDAGWVPANFQVGQTGKTVNPKLYIACGISGAIQHIVGMQSSKVIVAINNDPNAPIFNIATYGIVVDLFEVIPAMIKEIKRRREIHS
ncbi:MAG: electron transfer flavoprotein subunit alpha [Syntrophobacter sp. DG_60]|nr:MAG: electron transfer flavoprotein subunit alpha [Syntrophobacter sp. DG_60]